MIGNPNNARRLAFAAAQRRARREDSTAYIRIRLHKRFGYDPDVAYIRDQQPKEDKHDKG
jgi:hypothetical protein